MTRPLALALVLVLPLASQAAAAQQPALRTPAALQLAAGGATLSYTLSGPPNRPYAVLIDGRGGPNEFLGETLWLGLTPVLSTLGAGLLDTAGQAAGSLAVPPVPSLAGVPFFMQAAVDDPQGPNGVFRASNGESVALYTSSQALVERFDDPVAAGLTGNYDRTVQGRLQGGAVRRHLHQTTDPQGVVFGQPILTPLNPNGTRAQMVYRPKDLGSTGDQEIITAVHWRPHASLPVQPDLFPTFEIWMAHSAVMPDYTIDPVTALPRFPASGLAPQFAQNYKPGMMPALVFSGSYAVLPSAVRPDGYVPYPGPSFPFMYNGVDSLLIEFRVTASPASIGLNGQEVRLMVTSSAQPNARVVAMVSNPNTATSGLGDNAMHNLQFELLRTRTTATSRWLSAGNNPDYHTPTAAAATPPGTIVDLEYRGADDNTGGNATAWSRNIDAADGKSHLQYRVTLIGNRFTGAVPSVDTLVIPFN